MLTEHIGQPVGATSFTIPGASAAGWGINSTIEDMARFGIGVMQNTYVSADLLYGQILRPAEHSAGYGLGWGVSQPDSEDRRLAFGQQRPAQSSSPAEAPEKTRDRHPGNHPRTNRYAGSGGIGPRIVGRAGETRISKLVPRPQVDIRQPETTLKRKTQKEAVLLVGAGAPFDKIHEKHPTEPALSPAKITIGRWQVNRLLLDHAKTVPEAIQLLEKYNVSLGGTGVHFFVADALGNSAVIEYPPGGTMVVTRSTEQWQAVTNFFVAGTGREGGGHDRFARISRVLEAERGVLRDDQAMNLLSEVSQPTTAWSVVYNLSDGKVQVAMARRYEALKEIAAKKLVAIDPRDRPPAPGESR